MFTNFQVFRTFTEHLQQILALSSKVRQSYSQGKYNDALEIAEDAMKLSETLSQADPARMACCSNLALLYKTTGKYEQAISIYEPLEELYIKTLGPYHKATITLKHNLAATYKARGSPDLAIQLLSPLPQISSESLQSYVLKASCFKDLNDLANAKLVVQEADEYIVKTYGKGNVISVNLLNCKGLIHKNAKEFEEAEKCFKEALEIRLELNGEKHPETMIIRHNLGELYNAWGKKDQAREFLTKNIEIMQDEIKNK